MVLKKIKKSFMKWGLIKLKAKVLVVGLPNGGKTTIVRALAGESTQVAPTAGFEVETFKLVGTGSKVKLTTFDMSGDQKYRMLWDSFYADAQGVMFVVDASCAELDETKSTLHEVLGKTRPKIPVLILANKSDIQGACQPDELKDKLSVGLGSGRTTAVLSCCGVKNEGLQESMKWLLKSIRSSL